MGPKRRRLALSCVACRKRKVRCDRTFPTCVRCQKGSVSCDYVSYTKHDSTLPTPSEDSPHIRREGSALSWTGNFCPDEDMLESFAVHGAAFGRLATVNRAAMRLHLREAFATGQGRKRRSHAYKCVRSREDANVWHARAKEHENARTQTENQNATASQARGQPKPLQDLQDRVYDLETYVRTASSRPIPPERYLGPAHPARPTETSDKNSAPESERALLRGKGFKKQYFGPSHGASSLLQFEELSRFVKEILRRMPQLREHRNMWKHQRKEVGADLTMPDFDTMVALLPEQTRTDALVQEYFGTLETTYRVLHAPTFFRKYKEFWTASFKGDFSGFVAQLLLVCASVNCSVAGGPAGFSGRSSVGRVAALKWIELCQNWLDLQSQKHETLECFQVRVLLVIAKKLNCIKIKREWTASGYLLREAMSSGLHREPTVLSNNISVFVQEIRRRLWFTILELDLQVSLDRGMTASIGPFDWDTLPPLNLHDEDFDENTEKMPPTRPMTEFTRTSFLCLAQQHLSLRLDIMSRMNSIRPCLESDTAIEIDQKIREILETFPQWSDNAAEAMSKDLSELLLFEFLLLIHQPFATQADGQSKHFYSRAARRNAALSTMKIFTGLQLSSAKTLCNLRDDLYRACLVTCHDIIISSNSRDALIQDRDLAVRLVEDSVKLMEERTRTLGQGFHSYWLACSALGLLRSESAEKSAQETADRVAKLHEYMMSQQIAPLTGAGSNGVEDATMSTANTLVGMSGQPTPALLVPELDPFVTTTTDPFNAFSESLFDFDTDLWSMGGMGGGIQY